MQESKVEIHWAFQMGLHMKFILGLVIFSDHPSKLFNGGQIDISLTGIIPLQEDRNSLWFPYEAVDRLKCYLDESSLGFGWLPWRNLIWQLGGFWDGIIPVIKDRDSPGSQRELVLTLGVCSLSPIPSQMRCRQFFFNTLKGCKLEGWWCAWWKTTRIMSQNQVRPLNKIPRWYFLILMTRTGWILHQILWAVLVWQALWHSWWDST